MQREMKWVEEESSAGTMKPSLAAQSPELQ